jgi:hypothetical protein
MSNSLTDIVTRLNGRINRLNSLFKREKNTIRGPSTNIGVGNNTINNGRNKTGNKTGNNGRNTVRNTAGNAAGNAAGNTAGNTAGNKTGNNGRNTAGNAAGNVVSKNQPSMLAYNKGWPEGRPTGNLPPSNRKLPIPPNNSRKNSRINNTTKKNTLSRLNRERETYQRSM